MAFKKLALTTFFAGISCVSLNALAEHSAEVILNGILTNTTCDVTINGGKSVLNVAVLNTSMSGADNDFSAVNTISKKTVPMPVTLTNCTDDQSGSLLIQGITSVGNNEQNIFVAKDSQTVGFMIKDEKQKIITNGNKVAVEFEGKPAEKYTFTVGMATTTESPEAGSYSAPILVSYIVE
ncbi:type 1 fimbrial protein (plasmid) [Moellerella wisconsensis]|uniref:fimbrial protein n=1 Tax=Moellerella wisconsensis TaxID=158849 RepID=UPI001F4DDF89|nr:type 1 fimbrial protein [Moellerella wisconsensis]UNH29220.1 type 1 fimbrial protein [Moellerella wisconsensis]